MLICDISLFFINSIERFTFGDSTLFSIITAIISSFDTPLLAKVVKDFLEATDIEVFSLLDVLV